MEEAVRIAAGVCEGLAAAHAKGIIHRDIKPENVLLTEDGKAKVGDFGIAHVPRGAGGTSLTQAGFQPGTLLYMSPEQIRGQQVDGRSDVYQVGALLYEMLAGRHYVDFQALEQQARETAGSNVMLFQARLYELLAEVICEREPAGVCRVRPEVPEWMGEVVATALTKGVEARPAAETLAGALKSGEAVQVAPAILPDAVDIALAEEHYNLGVAYGEQGRLDDAIREYQAALRINPDYAEAHYGLGVAYLEQDRFENAITKFRAALQIDPDLAKGEAHFKLGVAYGEKGCWEEAIHEFETVLRLNPNYAEAHYNLGLAYGHQGRVDDEIREYQASLGLNPLNPGAHYSLSVAYAEQDRLDDFSRELQIAARQGSQKAQQVLANTRVSVEARSSASTDRQESIRLCNLGTQAKRESDYALALEYYDRAKQADRSNPQVYYNTGKLYFGVGEYGQSFRNLLTYTHMGLLGGLFDHTYFELFGFEHYFRPAGTISEEISVAPNIVQVLYLKKPALFVYTSDPNLTRYAGLCYLAENESALSFHQLGKDLIKDIQNSVLGKPSQGLARTTDLPNLARLVGFLYLAQNLAFDDSNQEVSQLYLSNHFLIDRDLHKWCIEEPKSPPF